ncbi:MAG: hypothetical protein IT377_29200 [Polyangiaceae bacterium]|nr:hypothetical protein [Polyangiaceae bacterium]
MTTRRQSPSGPWLANLSAVELRVVFARARERTRRCRPPVTHDSVVSLLPGKRA